MPRNCNTKLYLLNADSFGLQKDDKKQKIVKNNDCE